MPFSRRLLFLALAACLLALSASAQFTNQKKSKGRDPNFRNLEGLVTLPDGSPAANAIVQLKNKKTLAVRSFVTPETGKYNFQNLSSHIDFEIKAIFQNLESPTRTLTVFDTRLDAVMNLKLEDQKAKKEQEAKDKAEEAKEAAAKK